MIGTFGKGREFMIFICSSTKNVEVEKRVRGAVDAFKTSTRDFELTTVGVHGYHGTSQLYD